ncbi:alpha-soluble NSF attachment protein-like isoform X2 [Papaver somniferum]|uniref:alpha-soluble NSF attachment protein-like isoform X2 n=1 Tax=Papaver somniferum TaxID=3469 RepID=UPI000E6FD90B|nr:alpha-soluble NSF attachment protein-like isoform X2 [Papaver somniferum]
MDHDCHPLSPSAPTTSPLPPPSPDGFQRSALKYKEDQIAKGENSRKMLRKRSMDGLYLVLITKLLLDYMLKLLSVTKCQNHVIGKLYEVEQNIEKALINFERAADLFQNEKLSTFIANDCKQKVAHFSAQLEQYSREIAMNEDLAKQSLNKNLSKSSVKGYLLNAGLCQLFKADAAAVSNALEHYEELDPTFPGTHEYKFLAALESLD